MGAECHCKVIAKDTYRGNGWNNSYGQQLKSFLLEGKKRKKHWSRTGNGENLRFQNHFQCRSGVTYLKLVKNKSKC